MRLTHFFINRPRFAAVLSMFVTLLGLGALAILPVAQYPEVVPPTVQVTTTYPGASAETVARTVATPLEQEINGVENMLDLSSQLQVYLGSQYVNDFNYLGRTYKVVTQADGEFRRTSLDIARLKARNTSGEMVPIGTVAQLKDDTIRFLSIGRAVRELEVAARDRPDRSDVLARLCHWFARARPTHRYSESDRFCRPRRTGCQERDPDR
jgi:multidrug efflux pump subunit AcrB